MDFYLLDFKVFVGLIPCALSMCDVLQNKALSGGGMEDSVIDLHANVSIAFSTQF